MNECEEINEIFFVDRGEVAIGYELNKQKRFSLFKKDYCVIGGFNCLFDFTSEFIFYAKTDVHGNTIRQTNLKQILKQYPKIERALKYNVLTFYHKNIKNPMMKFKKNALMKLDKRNDMNQVLIAKDKFT